MTGSAAPNRGFLHRERIGPEGAGRTVLEHLAARFLRADADVWRQRVAEGQVCLEGLPVSADQRLRAGQWLTWARPPWVEPEAPLCTAVLYEDEDLLAVAKPDGLPTLPGGGEFQEHTLLALVRRRAPEASPMHRLGRSTTGLVLFARTAEARGLVQQAFRAHRLRKVYRALCLGHPVQDVFEVDAPIGEVPHPVLGSIHGAEVGGRPSLSRVRVLERREGASLLEVEIETGRPHQIRIHLAFAGHPLLGDPLYGPGGLPLPGTRALPGDPGYRLHALRLELVHPRTGLPLSITCAPPPVLRRRGDSPDF
jgi:23S rRNA pseudouridine1911/1915/1917 synthase